MTQILDAVLIRPDYTAQWVQVPADPDGSTLNALQAQVHGLIEAVDLEEGVVMWANEEGLLMAAGGDRRFIPNVGATMLASLAHGGLSPVVGPVVVIGDHEGETVSLPRERGDQIIAMVETLSSERVA